MVPSSSIFENVERRKGVELMSSAFRRVKDALCGEDECAGGFENAVACEDADGTRSLLFAGEEKEGSEPRDMS